MIPFPNVIVGILIGLVNDTWWDRKARFGMSHILSFYFIEYATATSSSLFFSIIAGAIREMV